MNAEQFLARMVGPGPFLAVAWKDPAKQTGGMIHRFFPREDVSGAAGLMKWASGKGNDVWFTPSSFELADQVGTDNYGRPKYNGSRTQANSIAFKSFWIDIDVRRVGDKKGSNVYETRADAIVWLRDFLAATGLPPPNMMVDSGYGFHVYWVLEDPMDRATWQPYADALVEALRQHGFKCEAGLSNDAARLLRVPETQNFKAGKPGVPVNALPNQHGDYPNQMILGKLTPYLGLVTTTVGSPPAQAASALAGGAPAAALTGTAGPNLNAAAQANVQPTAKRSFAELAPKCKQVAQSLAVGGVGDDRFIWYKGFLSLAHFCTDGQHYAHEISKGDPRYTAAEVDRELARVAQEQTAKGFGPPKCTTFDGLRPNVCQTCPHFNRITSPWVLGTAIQDGDLPKNYRRDNGEVQKLVTGVNGAQWVTIVPGDVYAPIVDRGSNGYSIGFTYELAGTRYPIRVSNEELAGDAGSVGANLARQSVTIEVSKFPLFREFLVNWISSIREQKGERTEQVPSFGFATNMAGDHVGVAVGGTLYRSDGTVEAAPGAAQSIIDNYTPHGDYVKWRQAFDLVCKGSIHRQVLVAAAFGSPLMHFTGQKGLMISAWGPSGVGKSAAMAVGQSVYSHPKMMSTLKTTNNAANHKAAATQFMPSYWDEMRIDKDEAIQLINRIFDMAQGQGAQRLTSSIQLRDPETWQTLAIVASNNRLMDFIVDKVKGNDAGAVRLFEFDMNIKKLVGTAAAAPIVQYTHAHYGHAGRMFLSWVATNYDETEKMVKDFTASFVHDLNQEGEERLYIAGLAAIMAGARIATKLGIAQFDLPGMYSFFKKWFLQLRSDRTMNLVTVGGLTDVEQVLSQFMSDTMASRLVTDKMLGAVVGRPPAVTILYLPQSGKVEAHIAEDDKLLRINHHTFMSWCRQRGLNALDVEAQIMRRFGAVVAKMTLAAGTKLGNGRLKVLELSLSHPALSGYATSTQMFAASALAQGKP